MIAAETRYGPTKSGMEQYKMESPYEGGDFVVDKDWSVLSFNRLGIEDCLDMSCC